MPGKETASLIFSILACLGVLYILYRVLHIEDFIRDKITKKFNSIAGHKGKALVKAREAATEDWKDLIFEVPEIKQVFPKLANQTLMGANVDPSLFGAGLLSSLSDLAPLLGMSQGGEISIVQLIPILIQFIPKIWELISKRRAGRATTPKTEEELKDEKAIPTTARLTY